MAGSSKNYCENRHVNSRTNLDKPVSKLETGRCHESDTYFNSLPGKCEIRKEDRDMQKAVINNTEEEESNEIL